MNSELDEELSNDLLIETDSIDVALIKQASIYMKWAGKLVNAIYERDRTKDFLDRLKAEVDLTIRTSEPEAYGLQKFTDSAITGIVKQDKTIVDEEERLIIHSQFVNYYSQALQALQMKKAALDNLVKIEKEGLFGTSNRTFSQPAKKEIEKKMKAINDEALQKNERIQNLRIKKGT